jgi:glycosyltransferase involved in cell wall biosynthesis
LKNFNLHTLIIGPRLNLQKSNLGGATQSFECLIQYYQDHQIPHKIIDTQYASGAARLFHFTSRFFIYILRADVIFFNASRSGLKRFSPFIYVFSRLFGKKVVMRPFGHSLESIYRDSGSLGKWVIEMTILKSDILYLQTEHLIRFFRPMSKHVLHLKTSRFIAENELQSKVKNFRKRFLFLGHIKPAKGISELVEAIKHFDDSYTIHLYGTIHDQHYSHFINEPFYKGTLKGVDAVMSTMKEYDVLVLPTYYEGEGYPGVIVEAYSLGLPVISTHWNAIPEIVEDGNTGFLINPKSSTALIKAIQGFNTQNHRRMSKKALAYYFRNFQIREVMGNVMIDIGRLLK